jgi:hypothetical protein
VRGRRWVGGFAVLAIMMIPPGAALAEDPADVADPRAVALPSFNESPGCAGPYGVIGPLATRSGYLSPEERVFGPWGDFFGRDMEEVHARLVAMQLPMADEPFTVYVHERVAPALRQVIDNLEREAAAGRLYNVRADFTWSYNPVTVPPGRRFSFHTVGAAIDVNSDTNPYRADNVLVTDMPEWFVAAWTDAGWCWGGDWQEVKDPMHFSWQGPLYTPGYPALTPMPPVTAAAGFTTAVTFTTGLAAGPAGAVHLVADVDRDGAPDAVRLRGWTSVGHLGVEAAVSGHAFETCRTHDITAQRPRGRDGFSLADWTGDGRPDLWAFDGSGATVRVEIYRWQTGYRKLVVRLPEVPTGSAVAYLAGDYDRDGRADLFVVRAGAPGSVEVWAGPGFARLLASAPLSTVVDAGTRVALGDYDVDGIPDVFLLAAGDAATLWVALGSQGFTLVGPLTSSVGAHPGSTLQVADYDGDGRDDLVFFDDDGMVTVYLGGIRGPEEELIGWFSESFAADWQFGEGCVPNPGFESQPGFLRARFADAAGPGAAFTYPNPESGIWTVADLWWRWWWPLPGEFVDLEPMAGPEGAAYAVLLIDEGAKLQVRNALDGLVSATIPLSARSDPIDLAVLDAGGTSAIAVVFAGDDPAVVVRGLGGELLAEVPLGAFTPAFLVAAADLTGDGRADLVAVGNGPRGGVAFRTISLPDGVVAQGTVWGRGTVEGAAVVPGTSSVAILLRPPEGRRGAVVVLDAVTGDRPVAFRTPVTAAGSIVAAVTGGGPMLVVATRNARSGGVRVEGRLALTGELRWVRAGSLGFDPADADQIESGVVVILGHRFGDGNVEVAWWNPATGARL